MTMSSLSACGRPLSWLLQPCPLTSWLCVHGAGGWSVRCCGGQEVMCPLMWNTRDVSNIMQLLVRPWLWSSGDGSVRNIVVFDRFSCKHNNTMWHRLMNVPIQRQASLCGWCGCSFEFDGAVGSDAPPDCCNDVCGPVLDLVHPEVRHELIDNLYCGQIRGTYLASRDAGPLNLQTDQHHDHCRDCGGVSSVIFSNTTMNTSRFGPRQRADDCG